MVEFESRLPENKSALAERILSETILFPNLNFDDPGVKAMIPPIKETRTKNKTPCILQITLPRENNGLFITVRCSLSSAAFCACTIFHIISAV